MEDFEMFRIHFHIYGHVPARYRDQIPGILVHQADRGDLILHLFQ